jgi:hypothetical protein
MTLKLTLCFFICIHLVSHAQNIRNEKFGAIKLENFNPKSPILKEDDAAVILSDVSSTEFEGNNSGDFTVIYKKHYKILIKKQTSFHKATVQVKLYQKTNTLQQKLEDIRAACYNIENGKIVQTILGKEGIVEEQYDKLHIIKKFTLPNVKEGSIIEYSYVIKTPFYYDLHSWNCQDEYPILWSEYQATIPPMFNYVVVKKGNYKDYMTVDSIKTFFKVYDILFPGKSAYSSSEVGTFSGDAKMMLYALENVPAYKSEAYLANSSNLNFDFQLHSIKFSENTSVQFIKSWYETVDDLMKNERFGNILNKEEYSWLNTETEKITDKLEDIEAIKKIYYHIQNKLKCINDDAIFMSDNPRKIYESNKGNVADINLLLTSMLIRKGFDASPVLLSTRGNGKANDVAAILQQYNYVICKVTVNDVTHYLDAADNRLGFGKLGTKCYNGFGRQIAKMPYLVNLFADSLIESKTTTIFFVNGDKNKLEGSLESKLGYYESIRLREKLSTTSTQDYFKEIAKASSFEAKIENTEVENIKKLEEPITIKYDIKLSLEMRISFILIHL